jgi:hypothetical protein
MVSGAFVPGRDSVSLGLIAQAVFFPEKNVSTPMARRARIKRPDSRFTMTESVEQKVRVE